MGCNDSYPTKKRRIGKDTDKDGYVRQRVMKPPTGNCELMSTDIVKERKKRGETIAKEGGKKAWVGGQISSNLSLGADLETDSHNHGGGNISEAYVVQPY